MARVALVQGRPIEHVRRDSFARTYWFYLYIRLDEERTRLRRKAEAIYGGYLTALAFNEPARISDEYRQFDLEVNPITDAERDRLMEEASELSDLLDTLPVRGSDAMRSRRTAHELETPHEGAA